MIFVWI